MEDTIGIGCNIEWKGAYSQEKPNTREMIDFILSFLRMLQACNITGSKAASELNEETTFK